MILIIHLLVFTILLTIVYFRFIRFGKKSLKRKIIKEHIKTITDLLKSRDNLAELNYYLLGDIRYNEDIIRKVISILKFKGFEANTSDVKFHVEMRYADCDKYGIITIMNHNLES